MNRTPRIACPSSAPKLTPKSRSAATVSGINPSPHAFSIGHRVPSATTTRKPFFRAAIAAASPAGPPPITNTSVCSIIRLCLGPCLAQPGLHHARRYVQRTLGPAFEPSTINTHVKRPWITPHAHHQLRCILDAPRYFEAYQHLVEWMSRIASTPGVPQPVQLRFGAYNGQGRDHENTKASRR